MCFTLMVAMLNQIQPGHQSEKIKCNLPSATVCFAVSDCQSNIFKCSVKNDYDIPLMYFFPLVINATVL